MMNLIKLALGSVGGFLGGIWVYLAVAVAAAGAATYATHHWDQNAYLTLQLKDANNVTLALVAQAKELTKNAVEQHALDTEVSAGAVAEARAKQQIISHTDTIIQEVPTYVTSTIDHLVPCIPYAVVRVLDAAALTTPGALVSPGDLALPPGKSDDACTDIKASDLARSIVGNYGSALENAEQLNALEAKIKEIIDTANKKAP